MMVFTGALCCKCDVIDEAYDGHQNTRARIEVTDNGHRVSSSSALNLLLLQCHGQHKTKGRLDEPILKVVICKSHVNYEILLALQVGIRHFTGQHMALPKEDLSPLHFKLTESTWMRYSKQNPKSFPPGSATDFLWKDYCPEVFRHLQELGNIDFPDYMMSVCGLETLRDMSSSGNSGSLLYRSKDDRFVIKTLKKSEVKALCEMLPNYLHHVKKYGASLVIKLYGLHAVRPSGGVKVYFVVMANVLQSDVYMHRCYDLKGSIQGRTISKAEDHERSIFKDLDLDFLIYLNPSTRCHVLAQIKSDCKFLEAQGIMDYSLLLGIHMEAPSQGINSASPGDPSKGYEHSGWAHDIRDIPNWPNAKLGVGIPARVVRVPGNRKDSMSQHPGVGERECYNALLFFGIIDILQGYNRRKHLEHAYKSIQYDSKSISAVNPRAYSARFQGFLHKVFRAK